jgi:Sulfotransferase family
VSGRVAMPEEGSGPIFIAGLDRTGTSLLYALLASHPRIAMTRRTNWWSYFDGRFGDLGDDRNLERCLTTMARYRRHRKLEPDFDRLRRDFVSGPRTYGRLFELLQRQHADRLGRPRWGDKSLHTERYAARVFGSFPDARIIHMIRDPRDRYASVLARWKERARGGVGAATAAWLASLDLAERHERAFPGRYMKLRYEDLAGRPDESLQALCSFIGEPYDPAMLTMAGARDFGSSGGNSSFGQFEPGRISAASIGRFRQVLRPADVHFVEAHAARRMLTVGYELEQPPLAARERLRYLVWDRPRAALFMAGWVLRERVRDLLGRSPSESTLSELAPVAGDQVSNV